MPSMREIYTMTPGQLVHVLHIAGWTDAALCVEIGVSASNISRWRNEPGAGAGYEVMDKLRKLTLQYDWTAPRGSEVAK